MPRTPLPTGSIHRTYYVRKVNDDFVRETIKQTHRSFTEVINGEIAFERTWGLPAHFARRLAAEAQRRGVEPRDLVQVYVHGEVAKWPAAPAAPSTGGAFAPRSTVTISGPNDAFLMRMCALMNIEQTEALDLVLDFNRRFDLGPVLLGAALKKASGLGATVRDLAVEILITEVQKLPDPPITATKPKK